MSELQDKIMRRVYIIRAVRRFISPIMLKLYVSVFLFAQLVARVSVADVWVNLPNGGGIESRFNFFTGAFAQTETAIKFLIIAGLVFLFWLAKDTLSSVVTPGRAPVRVRS